MQTRRKLPLLTFGLLLLVVTIWAPLAGQVAAQAQGQTDSRYFPTTGHTVRDRFLAYWDSHGGLAQQGYPLSEEFGEISPIDGKTYTVQYFERAVFEYHSENKDPYDVLLSLLGVLRYNAKYPEGAANQTASTAPGALLFKETGKTVGGPFLAYWKSHDGLAQQGLPISNEFREKSDTDGKTYTVQYFERAILEYHPENAGTPYEVLLSLLGTQEYDRRYGTHNQPLALPLPLPRPGFRQWDPHGSDTYLTWTEMSYDVPGEADVLALNLATKQVSMVTNKPGLQDGEDLSGSLVLWKDQGVCPCSKSDLYVTDLASGQLYDISGAVGSEYNNEARISGRAVAWLAYADSNPSVMLRDLDTGATITVAHSEPFATGGLEIAHVAVSDHYVVWDGALPATSAVPGSPQAQRCEIRSYDRRTREVRTVAGGPIAFNELAPGLALSGDRLVWADTRTHAADLSTGITRTLPFQEVYSQVLRGDLLVWHWQHAILAAHLDDSLATPVVIGDLEIDYDNPTVAGDWVVWETELGPNAGRLGTKSLRDVFNLPLPTHFAPSLYL